VNRYDRHILSSPPRRRADFVSEPLRIALAPPYLCYLAGTSLEQLVEEGEAQARRDTIVVAVLFVLGLFDRLRRAGGDGLGVRRADPAMEPFPVDRGRIGIILMGLHFLGACASARCFAKKGWRSPGRRACGAPI